MKVLVSHTEGWQVGGCFAFGGLGLVPRGTSRCFSQSPSQECPLLGNVARAFPKSFSRFGRKSHEDIVVTHVRKAPAFPGRTSDLSCCQHSHGPDMELPGARYVVARRTSMYPATAARVRAETALWPIVQLHFPARFKARGGDMACLLCRRCGPHPRWIRVMHYATSACRTAKTYLSIQGDWSGCYTRSDA